MNKFISILLYILIFVSGVAVAILSANDNLLVMWLGVVIALLSLFVGLQTIRDIDRLQKKAKKAVYIGETVGRVPSIDTNLLKEQLKKEYPELNP